MFSEMKQQLTELTEGIKEIKETLTSGKPGGKGL